MNKSRSTAKATGEPRLATRGVWGHRGVTGFVGHQWERPCPGSLPGTPDQKGLEVTAQTPHSQTRLLSPDL